MATAESLLQSDSFCFKVNRQHILAKRNLAFWMAPAMCIGGQGVSPHPPRAVCRVGGSDWGGKETAVVRAGENLRC